MLTLYIFTEHSHKNCRTDADRTYVFANSQFSGATLLTPVLGLILIYLISREAVRENPVNNLKTE